MDEDVDPEWLAGIRTNPGTDVARLLTMIDARDAEITRLAEGWARARTTINGMAAKYTELWQRSEAAARALRGT